MASRIQRRDFLRLTVVSAATIGAASLEGCASDKTSPGGGGPVSEEPADQARVYPQGVASGDPTPSTIILWTRVEPATPGDVVVHYELATDEAFATVVVQGDVTAAAAADNTLKLKVKDLAAYTTYYYRFTAENVRSVMGRTKTAPANDQDVPVRFAFATCQDFVGRYYHSWKALTDESKGVDFVVYLGDYVYETDGNPSFMTPSAARKIVLPDGLPINDTTKAAQSLEDYRALYKQYRSDKNLQLAHQLFPFVIIWDDHEFGDDCWQDHTTHFSDKQGSEQVPEQRQAADRAWFEYQPADVAFDENAQYPNDIKIYRSVRYGKNMDLFLTDQRYYRDDHVIPEGPIDGDVAKVIENSAIGARQFQLKSGFDPKEAKKKPTMLGATQKQWLIDGLKGSNATWKFWATETQLSQMLADLSSFKSLPATFQGRFYLTTDQWDGYRTERAEILTALGDLENLVAIAGDIHASYASKIYVDFDNPSPKPAAVEYVIAGISSQGIAPAAGNVLASNALFKSLGLLELIPRFDELLKQGSPQYVYADSFNNGVAICSVTKEAIEMTYLVVDGDDIKLETPGPIARVQFRTPSGSRNIEVVSDGRDQRFLEGNGFNLLGDAGVPGGVDAGTDAGVPGALDAGADAAG